MTTVLMFVVGHVIATLASPDLLRLDLDLDLDLRISS